MTNELEPINKVTSRKIKSPKESLIKSLLWTDLYKLTMGQAVFHNYPDLGANYEFINRGRTLFPANFADKLRDQIELLSKLNLTDSESEALANKAPFLKPDFRNFLSQYQFDPAEVSIDQSGGDLEIKVAGPWLRSIFWEVPLMTTVSELYYREAGQLPQDGWEEKAYQKGRTLKEQGVKTVEFGTRRAFSTAVHEEVLRQLIAGGETPETGGAILGTSNVSLALKHGIPMVGTYAHEWVQSHAAIFGVQQANKKAMEVWNKEYKGQFAIALTDTFTTDNFLNNFNSHWAAIFDGVRQDSGDPFDIGERIIAHYLKLGIDPRSKKIVFSDSLTTQKAIAINEHFKGKIDPIFGIGTHFTNDVGVKPLNMVIKLFSLNFPKRLTVPVVKLSDVKGKESGDTETISQFKQQLGITQ